MRVEKYDIEIFLDFDSGAYRGHETIYLSGIDPWIDAEGLRIDSLKVDGQESEYNVSPHGVQIAGEVRDKVEIDFEGKASETLMGLYVARSRTGKFYTTQFEPNGARLFIPCVDRPDYKARFRLTVHVNRHTKVISNMLPERVEDNANGVTYHFPETPPMSTYLLYLGVGDFDEIEDVHDGKKIMLAAYDGKSARGRYAVEVAGRVIDFYESYFGIKYPLPKLHLIAVPEFAVGAMENWGAITFREIALLADEKSSESVRRNVATVVAHEIAHQWFGDLVTMKWWDDLWLNESFATFMSYKAIAAVFPEWDHWEDFVLAETDPALHMDSLSTTHPIHVPVKSPEEAEQIFDDISYGKGASVLRMLEDYLGEGNFRKGIMSYLKANAYANATMNDLWISLNEASGHDVLSIMTDWVTKPGHPVLIARRGDGSVSIKQMRFGYLQRSEDSWPVPLTYYTHDGMRRSKLIKGSTAEIEDAEKLNVDGKGFYRVLYENFESEARRCRSSFDRWNLLSDAYAGLLSLSLDFGSYLRVAESFREEKSYLPAITLLSQLTSLNAISKGKMERIYREYLSSLYKAWKDRNDYKAKMFMGVLLRRLAQQDSAKAKELAAQDFFSTDPNYRGAVATAKAVVSNDPFGELLSIYSMATNDEDRVNVLSGLLLIRDKRGFEKALEFMKSEQVKKQDLRYITYATLNYYNYDSLWSWFTDNLDMLRRVFSKSGVLPRLISSVVPYVGPDREDEVKKFFERVDMPEAVLGIRNGLELLEVYARLRRSIIASL
ncbi:MAG: M1 family metallopeptidase [Nitrososphaeria archaeon]